MDQQEEYTGMLESELAEVDKIRLLNALGAVDFSERKLVDVLVAWGTLFDDIEDMDSTDEAVLAALIAVRDNPDLPHTNM
ncbi:MAG: hypothetical protein Q7K25_04485 [Actinomycetota bacterium]|nr:hypothetical protein [Actinomycetota bacterium]